MADQNAAAPASPLPAWYEKKINQDSFLKLLYNHNPFYVISAGLMLYSIQSMYGKLEIGEINCWVMTGVFNGYTLILALAGCLIIRKGKVWEDARSIVVIMLVLFMASSVSADDLFVRVNTPGKGLYLILTGYLCSAVISEIFLYGARIKLGLLYRIPYHLILASFFIAPWFYSPQQNPRSSEDLEMLLLLFPVVCAGLLLTLYPAVWKGADYIKNSGTPWNFPWFPWIGFGTFAFLMGIRTYLLCMAYAPQGFIWNGYGSDRSIVYDSIWGFYFLIPICLAILFLVLEYAVRNRNFSLANKTLCYLPLLFMLSFPGGIGEVSDRFYFRVTHEIGSPFWMTGWAIILFLTWASIRKVPSAMFGLIFGLIIFSLITPETTRMKEITKPEIWPLVIATILSLWKLISMRSSVYVFMASLLVAFGGYFLIREYWSTQIALVVISHFLLITWGVSSVIIKDQFSTYLKLFSGGMALVFYNMALFSDNAALVSYPVRVTYSLVLLAVTAYLLFRYQSWVYLIVFVLMLLVSFFSLFILGYRFLITAFGLRATFTFVCSIVALISGLLISSHKASRQVSSKTEGTA